MKSPPNKQKMYIGNKWALKLFFPLVDGQMIFKFNFDFALIFVFINLNVLE
jgi:hypothetical protein